MTRPKSKTRTRRCGEVDARKRLGDAEKYLEVAKLVAGEPASESVNVATGLAVLAGIAASDAACCRALGESSRGYDHHDAVDLLRQIARGGVEAARDFERLVGLKDAAHYGFMDVSSGQLTAAVRRAAALVTFARATLER